jgi:hypothetical protein
MATIANDTQFIGISPTIDLTGKKSAILNAQTEPVTMADIVETVVDNLPLPSTEWGDITGTLSNQTDLQTALNAKQNTLVIGKSGQGTTNGTTTITKSATIILEANKLSLNDTLNIKATFTNNGGIPYVMETYIYTNTSDTLTGATLVGKAQIASEYQWCGMERTFVYANYFGTNSLIGTFANSFFNSDIIGTPYYGSISLNNTVNNYIIFATKISSAFGGADARLNQATITKI